MANDISTIMSFGFGVGAFFASLAFAFGYGIYTMLSIFEDIAKLN